MTSVTIIHLDRQMESHKHSQRQTQRRRSKKASYCVVGKRLITPKMEHDRGKQMVQRKTQTEIAIKSSDGRAKHMARQW